MQKFLYEVEGLTVIVGQALAVHGKFVSGSISMGQKIRLISDGESLTAEVRIISHPSGPLNSAQAGDDVGIGLFNFNKDYANQVLELNPSEEEQANMPHPKELLKLEGDVRLEAILQ